MRLSDCHPGLQKGFNQEIDLMLLYQIFPKFFGIKKRLVSHAMISAVWVRNFRMGESQGEREEGGKHREPDQ